MRTSHATSRHEGCNAVTPAACAAAGALVLTAGPGPEEARGLQLTRGRLTEGVDDERRKEDETRPR
jgi:hypothetical protein